MKRESKYRLLDSRLRGNDRRGFTLVEILTTMAIIGILLAFLIPALSMIEKSAVKVKQRAQFHGIEVALEAFSTDTGDYPPSEWNQNVVNGYGMYSASQRLAEAVIGQDGFGFHPDARFRFDGRGDIDGDGILEATTLYDVVNDTTCSTGYVQTAQQNLAARKGPYLELENANAVKLSNLYGSSLVDLVDTYVLADMYKVTKNTATGKMTGSSILYYRANKGKTQHDAASANVDPTFNQCTYNVYDSIGNPFGAGRGIARQVPLNTKTGQHPLQSDFTLFYQQTLNPNFTRPPRPYRSESFILQSAGPDSLYGTADDVFNFEQE